MGDNDDIRPYDEIFSPGTVSNTKYLANGDMEEKELKTKQIIDKLVDDYVACRITYDEFSKEMKSFYADGDESKPILKEFDLEAAKAGKPVYTRDGRKARIICFDRNDNMPIVALIECVNHVEILQCCHNDGKVYHETVSKYDLMMLFEKKEGWVNVYNSLGVVTFSHNPYDTKKEALANVKPKDYVDTVKINWEE